MLYVGDFISALYANVLWIFLGSGLALLIWIIEKLLDKKIPRAVYVGLFALGLVVASYEAWRVERIRAETAERRIAEARPDPRKAEYRRRLVGIHQQSLRALRDAQENWQLQINSLKAEQRRHPADNPNQKRWAEEIERITRQGYGVVFEPVYLSALQLFDDMRADPIVDTTRARKLLEATRIKLGREQPHPRPEDVRAFADEIQRLADALR